MGIHVTALDSVDAARWSYMATVLAEALDSAVNTGAVNPALIPPAVSASARRFFSLALSVGESARSGNFQASVANYRLAADALRASVSPPKTRVDLESRMGRYAEFVANLRSPHRFSVEEIELARQLRDFFLMISADGAAEEYQRYAKGAEGSFETLAD